VIGLVPGRAADGRRGSSWATPSALTHARRAAGFAAGAAAVGTVCALLHQGLAAAVFGAAATGFGVLAWRRARAATQVLIEKTLRAEAEVRAAHEPSLGLAPLTPLLEALPDPALLVDQNGRVVGSNPAARQQLQFEAAGLMLSSVLRNPELLDAAQAAALDGQTRAVEYETTAQLQEHFKCYVAPVAWGTHSAALMVFHDVTSQINTERARSDFLANASHELRTPLASLTLLIETLNGPARDDEAARQRFLSMMAAQADRMRRLIDDLLSLSRIELNEHVPPSDAADLAVVAREVVDALVPQAREKGVEVVLSSEAPTIGVVGERFQLMQVAQNLVVNAIRYSPAGGRISVDVGLAVGRTEAMAKANRRWPDAARISLLTPAPSNKPYAFLRVADAGPGIARRHLPRLGERFFRVERAEQGEQNGTGLGLAICKHIMNRHRGGFTVESAPGLGSAFAVYLEAATAKPPVVVLQDSVQPASR
jgi:two-component system, OmpR family, phosphate regulon sensor histidine kinase PhoR